MDIVVSTNLLVAATQSHISEPEIHISTNHAAVKYGACLLTPLRKKLLRAYSDVNTTERMEASSIID